MRANEAEKCAHARELAALDATLQTKQKMVSRAEDSSKEKELKHAAELQKVDATVAELREHLSRKETALNEEGHKIRVSIKPKRSEGTFVVSGCCKWQHIIIIVVFV